MADVGTLGVTNRAARRRCTTYAVVMAVCAVVGASGLLWIARLILTSGHGSLGSVWPVVALLALQLTPCVLALIGVVRSRLPLSRTVLIAWAALGMLALPIEAVVSYTHAGPERGVVLLVVADACAALIAWNSRDFNFEVHHFLTTRSSRRLRGLRYPSGSAGAGQRPDVRQTDVLPSFLRQPAVRWRLFRVRHSPCALRNAYTVTTTFPRACPSPK